MIINCIRHAIESNFYAHFYLCAPFQIAGNDHKGKNIAGSIIAKYQAYQFDTTKEHTYLNFLSYIEKPEVQEAYLTGVLQTKTPDINLLEAYLFLQGKKLALFFDLNLEDGKLIDVSNEDINDNNTVCLVYHPSSNSTLSYYNSLEVTTTVKSEIPALTLTGYDQHGKFKVKKTEGGKEEKEEIPDLDDVPELEDIKNDYH